MKREDIIRLSEDFLLSKNIPTHKLISQVYGHGEISLTGLLADFALSLHQKEHEPTEPTMSQPMEQEGMSAEEFLKKKFIGREYKIISKIPGVDTAYYLLEDLLEQYAASRIAEGEGWVSVDDGLPDKNGDDIKLLLTGSLSGNRWVQNPICKFRDGNFWRAFPGRREPVGFYTNVTHWKYIYQPKTN